MAGSSRPRLEVLVVLLGLTWGVLTGGGCTAAGLAAGPLITSIQLLGDRSVERTLPADLSTAWAATVHALGPLDVQVREGDRNGETWTLKGMGDTVSVHGELRRVTPRMTRLSLTVEAGKLLADKRTAEEIANQISSLLAAPSGPPRPAAAPDPDSQKEALAALQEEIRRLGAKIEEREGARSRPDEGNKASRPAIKTVPGILEVPTSYGVPTIPAEAEPAGATSSRGQAVTEVPRPLSSSTPSPKTGENGSLAGSLRPVGTLAPVDSLTGPRSGR